MDFLFNNVQDQLIDAAVVVFAAVLSGLIGIEREHSGKPAGFRTHMLVSGASALLILLSGDIVEIRLANDVMADSITTDPVRVMEAIIVGIGFIGAGTVLKVESNQRVRYLTTAASILFAAGVGIAVALHEFILAVLLVVIVLVVNVIFGKISDKVGDE